MKKYLIDINIISYLADAESIFHENVRARFRLLAKGDEVFLSILSLYEFHFATLRKQFRVIRCDRVSRYVIVMKCVIL
jgi:predicted nucleic acid-binding protein